MAGMRMRPRAATVAGPEPLTAPQKVATPTVATARPPVMLPTMASTSVTMRAAMPARSMMKPARMKKGMASSGTLAMPAKKL